MLNLQSPKVNWPIDELNPYCDLSWELQEIYADRELRGRLSRAMDRCRNPANARLLQNAYLGRPIVDL